MKTSQVKSVLCGLALVATALAPAAQAAHKHGAKSMMAQSKKRAQAHPVSIEAWPGQRVMLVLPLALSTNWNSDPALGRALLFDGESNLEHALRATNKLSLLQLQRNNPVFQRAIQDKVITNDELAAWTPADAAPTLENAHNALGKLVPSLEQAPLIGDFALEEIRSNGDADRPSVQVQVSGRVYGMSDLANPTPKNYIATSLPMQSKGDTLKALRAAANNAFEQIAMQIASPIEVTNLTGGGTAAGGNTAVAPGNVVAPAVPATPVLPSLPDNTTTPAVPAPGTPGGPESPAPVTPATPATTPDTPAVPAAPATPAPAAPEAPAVPAPATPAAPESPAPVTPAPTAPAI